MSKSRLWRLGWALVAACCSAVLLASLAAGQASAADCTVDNVFRMNLFNTCNSTTQLSGSAGLQFFVTGTDIGATAIDGVATATSGFGIGVKGTTVSTSSSTYGVYGLLSTNSAGLQSAGVFGQSISKNADGVGVYGQHTMPTGTAAGVLGDTYSGDANASGVAGEVKELTPGVGSTGVRGINNGVNGNGYGVWGSHAGSGTGVYGQSAGGTGVRGVNNGTNASGYGVWGSQAGSGTGVYGQSRSGIGVLGTSSNIGLYGFGTYGVIGAAAPAGGLAGYFVGDVHVTGTLTKGAGAFRIDHPLDPAHKYLQHSFVESPDMMDVYNGNVTTDSNGFANVRLPSYFQALNRSFRYQLTLVGRQAWGAQAVVWQKIRQNRFVIRSKPGVEVSWQVTGVRHDAYANAHRIPVVLDKSAKEQGRYLHPDLYGKPRSQSIVRLPAEALGQARRRTPPKARVGGGR
jgi:hypothetical protein